MYITLLTSTTQICNIEYQLTKYIIKRDISCGCSIFNEVIFVKTIDGERSDDNKSESVEFSATIQKVSGRN